MFRILRLSLAIFLLIYSADVLPLAPVSKFISWNVSDKNEFITYYVTLFSVLYVSSQKISDTKEYQRAKDVLVKLNNALVANGISLTIKNIEYIKSQPGVIYCTFKIGEAIRTVRVFDRTMRPGLYPAKVLYETTFNNIGKTVQVITNNSYNVIGIGEEKVVKTPYGSFDRYAGIFASLVMRALTGSFMAYNFCALLSRAQCFSPLPLFAGVSSFLLIAFIYDKSSDMKILAGLFCAGKNADAVRSVSEPAAESLKRISREDAGADRQKLVAIETDWLSLVYTNEQLSRMMEALQKRYHDRLRIIFNNSSSLFSDIMKEVQTEG